MKTRENTTIKKRRGLFSCLFIILIPLFLIVAAVMFAINWYNDAIYNSSNSSVVTELNVNEGDTLLSIADKLESEGLIKSKDALRIYVRLNNIDANIKPGQYNIPHNYTVSQIIEVLEQGVFKPSVWVTVREGLWDKEVAEILLTKFNESSDNNTFSTEEFLNIVDNPDSQTFSVELSTFLNDVKPMGKPLTGFLFPDTYRFDSDASELEIIETMVLNFQKRMIDNQIDMNNVTQNQNTLENFYEVLSLASILEKESGGDEDDNLISGVFHNRLADNYPLESDVTVNFAKGKDELFVSFDDIEIDSPYNTYKYAGLIPTPINNPGIRSIKATLNPETTNYYFFWRSMSESKTYFGVTFNDHQLNIVNHP
jgi:UPF0755 protein